MTLLQKLYGLKDGTTTYDEVREAVRGHKFTPLNNEKEWDYARTEGSWTDTVYRAKWLKLITEEQYEELRQIAYGTEEE